MVDLCSYIKVFFYWLPILCHTWIKDWSFTLKIWSSWCYFHLFLLMRSIWYQQLSCLIFNQLHLVNLLVEPLSLLNVLHLKVYLDSVLWLFHYLAQAWLNWSSFGDDWKLDMTMCNAELNVMQKLASFLVLCLFDRFHSKVQGGKYLLVGLREWLVQSHPLSFHSWQQTCWTWS